MEQTDDERKIRLSVIAQIREKRNRAAREFESGNFTAAGRYLAEASAGIRESARAIAEDYPRCLFEHKLVGVNPESGDPPEPPTTDKEVMRSLAAVQQNVGVLEREIQSNYPAGRGRFHLRFTISRRGRFQLAGGTLVAILAAGIMMMPAKKGLSGAYYTGANFEYPYKTRVDKSVDFFWGYSAPFSMMARDFFSVRWTGYLRIPKDGYYEFMVRSDDGIRFTLGNALLVDNWRWQALTETRARVLLQAGYYPLQMDYFDHKKTATVSLSWKREDAAGFEIVPASNLVPKEKYLDPSLPVRLISQTPSGQ